MFDWVDRSVIGWILRSWIVHENTFCFTGGCDVGAVLLVSVAHLFFGGRIGEEFHRGRREDKEFTEKKY